MRKRIFVQLLLAGVIAMVSAAAIAQDNDQQGPPPGGPQGGHRHFDPQKRTEMLTKQLKLTSDQQAKVLDIFKNEQSQMEGLRSDTSMSQDDRRAKMMDIHKASDDQVRALLDANQQKKFDAMQAQRGQWGHPPNGQGAPPSAPPPQQ